MTGTDAPVFTGPSRVLDFADSLDTAQPEAAPDLARWETWVTFQIAGERFAFAVDAVREIVRVRSITRVPHAPDPVRGIINLRGRVVPVLDLRRRLGLPAAELTSASRILICHAQHRVLGLLVDAAHHVVRLDRNQVEPPPADVMTAQSGYVLGVSHHGGGFLILLDADQVLLIPDQSSEEKKS